MHKTSGIPITSWLRACFALRDCAIDSRGFAELVIGDDDVIRWPRTTGGDVIAIAAVLDPALREQRPSFGGHGLTQRWSACVDDLERCALTAPDEEYEHNQRFWQAVPDASVYLHSQKTPLPPPEILEGLLALLAAPVEPAPPRNHTPRGPAPLDKNIIEDIYVSEFELMRAKRGADKMKPEPGTTGGERWIPRTTNSDVTMIARFWTWVLSQSPQILGHDAVQSQWLAASRDIDELARGADPHAVYAKNNAFWRALHQVAIQVAVAIATTRDSNTAAAITGAYLAEPRNVGPKGDGPFKHFDDIKGFHDLWLAQFVYLRDQRGFDKLAAEPGMIGAVKVIPRTTNEDVILLADYWSKQLASVKRIQERSAVEARWNAALVDIDQLARKGDPKAVYPKNNGFWRVLQDTATHVSNADEAKSSTDLAIEAIKDSVNALPDRVKGAVEAIASGAADVAGNIAHTGGEVVNKAVSGLFGEVGKYVLIGGVGIAGLILLTRSGGERGEKGLA